MTEERAPGPSASRGQALRVPCLHNPDHETIEQHLTGTGFVWIDLESPSEADLLKLSETTSSSIR